MPLKPNFTDEEWQNLLVAPYLTAVLIVIADPNFAFFKELAAVGQSIMLSTTESKNELIREIAQELSMKETQEEIKPELEKIQGQKDPEALKQTMLETIQNAAETVYLKSAENNDAYRKWLLYLAQQAAEGSKEGGFLGIGAVRVSDREKTMLNEIAQELGIEEG